MPKQIVIAEQHRIAAVFSEEQIQELIVATGSHQVSDIYLGVVENVLPGIDAAFVNIGDAERNGFIHVSDLGPLRLRRSAGSITELLAPQQKVLVQVMKEPTGNKGPRLTGKVTLPGRYLVLIPYGRGVNLSRRIERESERHRLRALAILVKPSGMGLLVRTEAEGVPEEAILEDLEALQRQWESIQQQATSTRPPALLNRDDDFIQRVLRDAYTGEVNRIVADSSSGMKRVKQHLASWSGGKSPQGVLVDQHRERVPILEYFRVNAAIREALKPRVDLPSGGYIIIEPTEALTVIDVNSGSFTRSATARETVLWTNCEAAVEIARQLRLRNIAGVIVVDFIDMESHRDQLQVLENFSKALKSDKARPQIAQLSELGLVELTRKRQGQNLYELFGRACPTCGGLGHLVHLPDDDDAAGPTTLLPGVAGGTERPGVPMLQRNRPVPVNRRSGRSPAPPPAEPASPTVELEPAEDLQELDLTNHPSYQEQGSNSRRRRRRRSSLSDALNSREEDDSRPASRSDSSRGDSSRSDSNRSDSRRSRNAEAADRAEESNGAAKGAAQNGRASNRGDRNGAGKAPAADAGKAPADSGEPETVVVEMTPEEQEAYAWMGLSPLLLHPQPPEKADAAVVKVVSPGERRDDGAEKSTRSRRGSRRGGRKGSSNGSGSAPADSPDAAEAPAADTAGKADKPVKGKGAPEKAADKGDSTPEPVLAAGETASDGDSKPSPSRRRRRRSTSRSKS